MSNPLFNKLKQLNENNRGAVAMILGIMTPLFVVGTGTAVDFSRFVTERQLAQKALDGASLSAAIELSQGSLSIDDAAIRAEQIFRANLLGIVNSGGQELEDISALEEGSSLAEGESALEDDDPQSQTRFVTIENFQVFFDPATATVRTSVDLSVPTTLSTLLGVDSLDTTLSSASAFEGTSEGVENVEFSFVLDVTGSMSRGGRLEALQEALRTSVNILLPEDGANDNRVRVGFVPYAYSVNIGEDLYLDAVGQGSASALESRNTCVTEREGDRAFDDLGPQQGIANTLYETDPILRRYTSGACPSVVLRPLTNDRDALLDDIEDFTAAGFTGGHMGIAWGLNVLSQEFQDFWPDDASPSNYSDENTRKILVVMTDGEFNTAFYDEHTQGSLSVARSRTQVSREAALDFCDLAKEDERNIRVYTIAFKAGGIAENMLRQCASEDDPDATNPIDRGPHFFDASSDEELAIAFRRIIAQELKVVLTQ